MRIEEIAYDRGYRVTDSGVLLNPRSRRIGTFGQRARTKIKTYQRTMLRVDGKHKTLFTHRLQAYQKYGKSLFEEGIHVRHKNGVLEDNSRDNILIGTASENAMDKPVETRIRVAGISSYKGKYNKDEIREFFNECGCRKTTADRFNMPIGSLHYVLHKKKR